MPELSNHVNEAGYLYAARRIDSEICENNGDAEATLIRRMRACHREFILTLREIGEALAAVDRTLGVDEEVKRVNRRAILCGGVAGLAIVRYAYDPEVIMSKDVFGSIELDGEPDVDMQYNAHLEAETWQDFGWEGIRFLGKPAEDLVEDWETKLIPDARYQSLVRVGVGLVVYATRMNFAAKLETRHKNDLRELEKQLASPDSIDWDKAFAELKE